MKTKKKIIILDISSNLKLHRNNCYVIKIDTGNIDLKNFRDFTRNLNIKKNNLYYNKIISSQILEYIKKFKKFLPLKFLLNLEIANFREDKVDLFDKIKCFLEIKKLKLDKKFDVEIISDKKYSKNIYHQLFRKFKLLDVSENKKINFQFKYFYSRTRFAFKIFFVTLYLKLFHKKKYLKEYSALSIYPNMNSRFVNTLYKLKKPTYLNFLISDETHTDTNFFKIIEKINVLSKKEFFHIEQEIELKDIIFDYFKSLKMAKFINEIQNTNLIIEKINFKVLFQNYFLVSLLNISKMMNYEKPLIKIFDRKNKIKEFHYFLFEYNFGFFISKTIKSINSEIKLIGYQHGIFGKNTPWLDVVSKSKLDNLLPEKIFYLYKESKKAYLKKISAVFKPNLHNIDKFDRKLLPTIERSSHNCLIYLGLHDGEDIINQTLYDTSFSKKFRKIYFKYHPKKKDIISKFNKNDLITFIEDVSKIKVKSIYLSSSSSLSYIFKELKISYDFFDIPYKSYKK